MTDIQLHDLPLAELNQHIATLPLDKNRIKGLSAGTITGQIDSSGGITAGTGFTVNHSGTGTYVITFTTAFSAAPTVVGLLAEAQSSIVKQTAVSASAVTILITSTSNAAQDRAFNFIAMATV